jgi:uncharacterized membrane protein (DUF373 family)
MEFLASIFAYALWFVCLCIIVAMCIAFWSIWKKSYNPANTLVILVPAFLLFVIMGSLAFINYFSFLDKLASFALEDLFI